VAAKLARDFADFDERANAVGDDFYRTYRELKRGIDMAADGGALNFH
jgi:DNA-binding ferritin-like protein (Dps family)